jgi:hypothetical protein
MSEWSRLWTTQGAQRRVMTRGSERYVMGGGLITEVRAYLLYDDATDTLTGFSYAEREYLEATR